MQEWDYKRFVVDNYGNVKYQGQCLSLQDVLPQLKDEGWEVDSIIPDFSDIESTIYTLKRPFDERVYIDKLGDGALNALSLIICPKCGMKNADYENNCLKCRINLKWAIDNYEEQQK